jgi:hypothetical protein
MRKTFIKFLLFILFASTVHFVSAQSLRVVALPAQSNFEAPIDCYKQIADFIYLELSDDDLKLPSRTFCRVFFNQDGQITDVKTRSGNATPKLVEHLNFLLRDITYCWATPMETKETVFHLAFAIRIE